MVVPGYDLVRPLSPGGGPTEVWCAAPSAGGDLVALKMLIPDRASEDRRLRFFAEAGVLRRLGGRHGVIGCLGVVTSPPAVVLEFMPGGTMRDRLVRSRLSPEEAIRLGVDTARTLQWLHDHHVIHRDLKPSNILIAADGSTRVADLGVAAQGHPPRGLPEGWVEESVGTLGYAAPELVRDAATATPAVDVYGLGAVLYEALTGRLPVMMEDDETEAAFRGRIISGAAPVPLAGRLSAVIMRAVDPDPGARLSSARALAEALLDLSEA